MDWPYPVEWDTTEKQDADVLVIGGGASGCFAAMGAASRCFDICPVPGAITLNRPPAMRVNWKLRSELGDGGANPG